MNHSTLWRESIGRLTDIINQKINDMSRTMNYLSPVCAQIEVCAEGILCSSERLFTGTTTEKFESIDEFTW